MNNQQQLARLQDELDGVALYTAIADAERDPKLAEVYRRMAQVEQRHADALSAQLGADGIHVPAFRPSFRTCALSFLAKRFGVALVLPSISTLEQLATHDYARAGNVLFSGMRQVLFGLAAAALTFGIGRLIGVNLGG
jgi:hypothetical protein